MAWWAWVLVWVILIGAALGVFAVIGLSLWGQIKDLMRELSIASERFALISQHLEKIHAAATEPAVFDDVSRLRREREKAVRRAKAMTTMRIKARQDRRPAALPDAARDARAS